MSKTLTMRYQRPLTASRGSVYGAWVVTDDFLTAILTHGTWDRYAFLTSEAEAQDAGEALGDLRRTGVSTVLTRDLRGIGGNLGTHAWHCPYPDATLPFLFRRRFAERAFPVTMVHHSVSYQEFLHREFLRMLLDEPLACDSLICTSSAARHSVQTLLDTVADRFNAQFGTDLRYRGRLDTIPLGVDTERLCPGTQERARHELGLPADRRIVLWLGRVSAADKADLGPLLTAFADVLQYLRVLGGEAELPPLLVIAGADPQGHAGVLASYARALGIGEHIRLRTEVDAGNKASYYRAADVFVAPTDNIQETYGLAPVEAMACGVPQVVSDWDGYRDTVVDGETGILVPTTWARGSDADLVDDPIGWYDRTDHAALAQSVVVDPSALRAGLMRLLLDADLRRRMGAASRVRAEERFGWPTVIAAYEALWAELGEIAAVTPLRNGAPPSLPEPFFMQAFGNYASRLVDDDQGLRITPAGRTALQRPHDLVPEAAAAETKLMRAALERLADSELSLGDLIDALAGPDGTAAGIRRQLMRLAKYGFAELS